MTEEKITDNIEPIQESEPEPTIIESDLIHRQVQITKPNITVILSTQCELETMNYLIREARKLMNRYENRG